MSAEKQDVAFVYWLEAAQDTSRLGGKGRSLSQLAGAGLPIPPGFTLTADALPCEPERITELPKAAARQVAQAYAELGRRVGDAQPLVAVRSSGLAEDLAHASFAGLYETVLGVRGLPDLQTAVLRCWNSLWSPGVAAYREAVEQRTGQLLPPPSMAVVVQALVSADAAGVAETIDTITGSPETITIRAAWGLGRSVVDGSVEADLFRVQRNSLAVVELKTGKKTTHAGTGLNATAEPLPEELQGRPSLTLDQAARVARLALEAEKVIGCPADVEWALAGEQVWLLQARPLTGQTPQPAQAAAQSAAPAPEPIGPSAEFPFQWPDAALAKFHWQGDDRVFVAQRPFDLDVSKMTIQSEWRAGITNGASEILACMEVNGYLFTTKKPFPGSEEERKTNEKRHQEAMRALYDQYESYFEKVILPQAVAGAKRLGAVNPDGLDAAALAEHFEQAVEGYEYFWILHSSFDSWDDFSPVGRCTRLYSELTGEENGWAVFEPFGYAPHKDHETLEGVILLAQAVKDSPALLALFQAKNPAEVLAALESVEGGPEFQQQFSAFCQAHPWMAGSSMGIMGSQVMAGWLEEPALLIGIIQRYLPQDLEKLLKARQKTTEQYPQLIQRVREKVAATGTAPAQIAEFDRWYSTLQRMVIAILDHNYYIDGPMNALLHWSLMASGRKLAAACVLDAPEDIWWLRAHQIPAALRTIDSAERGNWRSLVAGQKAIYEWQRSLKPPPYLGAPPVCLAPPPTAEAQPQQEGEKEERPPNLLVKGDAASPGTVTGRVRIIDYTDLMPDVQPGDIFVAKDCGLLWGMLLPVVSGVVLEGSNGSEHPMRLCHEFGVPGIVQAKGATRLLREGQTVMIDGSKGWVLSA
jgi:pyruvate,water dikinase